MHLYSNVPGDHMCGKAEFAIRRPAYFLLTCGHPPSLPTEADILFLLEETVRGWRTWSKACALPSFAPDHVLRSALCLELHICVGTGVIGPLLDVRDGRVRAGI